MEQEQLNKNDQALEDNLPMVTYIMLHRIYDLMTLIANKVVGADDVSKMIQYHNAGYLLGPNPSYTPAENEEEDIKP